MDKYKIASKAIIALNTWEDDSSSHCPARIAFCAYKKKNTYFNIITKTFCGNVSTYMWNIHSILDVTFSTSSSRWSNSNIVIIHTNNKHLDLKMLFENETYAWNIYCAIQDCIFEMKANEV